MTNTARETGRVGSNPCPVDGTPDDKRPMCYMGEPWCSDDCRKVVQREKPPTDEQWEAMTADLYRELMAAWKPRGKF